MSTRGAAWFRVCTVVLLFTGSTGLVCYTAVKSLDLGCLLRWDCPHASPNITYTVQTKTQGDPWQDVPWCVWISSNTCDVSQVFYNFELYNMIRLGVHLGPGSTVWIKPHKFDYSDFTFSPPSISVSLNDDDSLSVKVQFPCAANRRCSREVCCPISQMIDPWTTVTISNQLNRSDHQSRTVWTQEVASIVEFSGLSPGQNYCVVANFSFPTFSMAASPQSASKCVETVTKPGMLPMLCLGIGLSFLFLFLLVIMFLRQPRRAGPAPENQPKPPASVHDLVPSVPPTTVPVDPCDIHLEFADDPISSSSSYSFHSHQDLRSGVGAAISSKPVHLNSSCADEAYHDNGGLKPKKSP
ncbi:uncharacterized protein si:dkeyp-75h12.7 [Austrofundulus limnaeus]|uniref:Uncharacterized protein si:dkeyp-75h12.7 n=1 Tax=Austrofundulus limnaeus TaxID=52670 RepID=A0A2I4CLX7_AUSLI|nr:PREDICTED: uncharacterized protein LOC106529982 [Austrofundulus limnaeus]